MRIKGALIIDFKFQVKHGFYVIYAALTIMYMVIMSILPMNYKQLILPLLIYTDPSFVGLFFVGGIIMLEKLQGTLDYLEVTPLRKEEYLLSKLISLSTLAIIASIAITLTSGYNGYVNYILLCLGVTMVSVFYILIGVIVADRCRTLNQYIVKMIPAVMILALPCFSIIFKGYSYIWTVLPSVAGLRILLSAYYPSNPYEICCLVVYTLICNYLLFTKVANMKWRGL